MEGDQIGSCPSSITLAQQRVQNRSAAVRARFGDCDHEGLHPLTNHCLLDVYCPFSPFQFPRHPSERVPILRKTKQEISRVCMTSPSRTREQHAFVFSHKNKRPHGSICR